MKAVCVLIILSLLILSSACVKSDQPLDSSTTSSETPSPSLNIEPTPTPSAAPTPDTAPTEELPTFDEMLPLEELSEDYTFDDAVKDGCVVYKNGQFTASEERWNEFISLAQSGKDAAVRVMTDFTYGAAASRYYPDTFSPLIYDVVYSNNVCTIIWKESGKMQLRQRSYLTEEEIDYSNPLHGCYGGDIEAAKADSCVLIDKPGYFHKPAVLWGEDLLSKFISSYKHAEEAILRSAFVENETVAQVYEYRIEAGLVSYTYTGIDEDGRYFVDTRTYPYFEKFFDGINSYVYILLPVEFDSYTALMQMDVSAVGVRMVPRQYIGAVPF